ncbi:MAG: T9SS type A sorting domain-containing protein, partial [Bacteroidales bacterium]|nr:T9SS type A sorting domain-containing protein [Candidatus Scybalousia scybalohippi]
IINTIYDTITIENTDTIYITETPCARVSTYIYATINPGEIYSMNGFNEVSVGVYTHNFETYDGCDSTVTLILSVNSSLENISRDVTLKLYPNPTQDNVVLNLDGIEKDSKIFLTDIQGRRIREYILKAEEKTLRIDMQDLESGAYYLRIVSDNFQRTEKIIKK